MSENVELASNGCAYEVQVSCTRVGRSNAACAGFLIPYHNLAAYLGFRDKNLDQKDLQITCHALPCRSLYECSLINFTMQNSTCRQERMNPKRGGIPLLGFMRKWGIPLLGFMQKCGVHAKRGVFPFWGSCAPDVVYFVSGFPCLRELEMRLGVR